MPIPFALSDDEYIKEMYAYEAKGIGIYRHIPPERLLDSRWMNYKNYFWVSDFGGIAVLKKNGEKRIGFPTIIYWHKGVTACLVYNLRKYFLEKSTNTINLNIPTTVYKLFNGYPIDFIFHNFDTSIQYYNKIVWDCRVENLSLTNTYNYGINYDE